MRVLVALTNAVAWPLNWLLERADRNVCRFANVTAECPACPFPDDRAECCHDGARS